MGTSSSYPGPGKGSPLLPPWADDDSGDISPNGGDTSSNEPLDDRSEQDHEQHVADESPLDATVDLAPARRYFKQYTTGAGLNSLALAVGAYVVGMGGARNAAKSARAGRNATRRLAGFLSNVATRGVETALDQLDLGRVVGRSAEVVLAAVEDVLAPSGATIDEAAARHAMSATLRELYDQYALADQDIYGLNQMDAEGVKAILHLYVTNYIYERLLNVMQKDLDGQDLNEQQLIRAEHEIMSFTRETVRLELDDVDILAIDWNDRQGASIVARIYEQAYAIWEAMRA